MNTEDLKETIRCGETTTVQFKQEFTTQKKIVNEMVAFANSKGGMMIFGVEDKTGEIIGLSYEQLQRTSSELGNVANENVRPTIYITTEVAKIDGKHLLVCNIAEGANKPYKNLDGEIWVKQGSDKRRVTENSEILSLFQQSQKYFPDQEAVTDSSMTDIDHYALDEYLKKVYGTTLDGFGSNAKQVLQNIHVLHKNGNLTLAGYLFFGRNPEFQCPTFMVKAVSFFGNKLSGSAYRDSKEIVGNMTQLYEKSMTFLKSNLHSLQEKGASFNTLGKLEISEEILEEIVQNALIHRDYLRSAPIRILIFDNRVEIVSPGCLAGGLTEYDIRNGKTYQRNPFMSVFATNALRYRGIGSGIVRILNERKDIIIKNDESGNEFTITIPRSLDAENVAVYSQNDTVNSENDTVKLENVAVNLQNDTVNLEIVAVNSKVDSVNHDNDTVNPKNDTVNQENVTVNSENVTVNQENVTINDTVNSDDVTINDTVNSDDVTINPENVTVNSENVAVNPQNDSVHHDDVTVNLENVTVNLENDTVNLEGDSVNPQNDSVNPQNDTVNSDDVTINPKNVTINDTVNSDNVTINVTERQIVIMKVISSNKNVTVDYLVKTLNVASRTIKRDLKFLQKNNLITHIGPNKTGHWEIITKNN